MINVLTGFPDNVVAVACHGHVTRGDYREQLVPAVEAALQKHDRLRLYYEIGADFAGMAPGAMWEDFKVGVEHVHRWGRVAVVTDVEWIGQTVGVFAFLISGETKVFPLADRAQARAWIAAPPPAQ